MARTDLDWVITCTPNEHIEHLSTQFQDRFGYAPAGIWSAPGRVNLLGEHVDYNDGVCMPFAIPQRTYVAAGRRSDNVVRAASLQSDSNKDVSMSIDTISPGLAGILPARDRWFTYVAGVPWALRQAGESLTGLDLLIDSDVPIGGGLSSSAAIECAVALAFDALGRTEGTPLLVTESGQLKLAEACVAAENKIAGANTGGMDQAVSIRAKAGCVLVLDCADQHVEQLRVDMAGAGYALLVTDTRAPHQLVDGQYANRRAACDVGAKILGVPTLRQAFDAAHGDVFAVLEQWQRALDGVGVKSIALGEDDTITAPILFRRVRHVFTEMARVNAVIQSFDQNPGAAAWRHLGGMLSDSHLSLRNDYNVTIPELDAVVDEAVRAGALGARMTGGGFGGSVIALVDSDRVDEIANRIDRRFAESGFAKPQFLLATPEAGAHADVLMQRH